MGRKNDLGWKLYALEIDKYGKDIGKFFGYEKYPITSVDPREGQKWRDLKTEKNIEKAIEQTVQPGPDSRVLALYGSGQLHHFTYGLCKLADKISDDYCYIHIDFHHDWWPKHNINCASFVKSIFGKTNVGRQINNIMIIGAEKDDMAQYLSSAERKKLRKRCLLVEDMFDEETYEPKRGWLKAIEELLNESPKDVYISMDLDVLHPCEISLLYEQGMMEVDGLLGILKRIKSKKRIIGADVVGYIGGNFQEILIYKDIVDCLTA